MSRDWSGRRRGSPYRPPPRSAARRLFDYGLTLSLFAVLVVLATRLDQSQTRTGAGVAIVGDGDSITLNGERMRLLGIDAPEYEQTCDKDGTGYACGRLARQALVDLIGARRVSCSGSRHDRYKRLLADCKAGDIDLNRAQVKAGWAVAYGDFEAEEGEARAARRGIWAGTFEVPQDWRRDHGRPTEQRHDALGGLGDRLRGLFRW